MRNIGAALACAALCALAPPALAADWRHFTGDAEGVGYIDLDSVQREGDVARYTVRTIFKPGSEVADATIVIQNDCARRTGQLVSFVARAANGENVSDTAPPNEEPIRPGSRAEEGFKVVCQREHGSESVDPTAHAAAWFRSHAAAGAAGGGTAE